MVLADEIRVLTSDADTSKRHAPMRREGVGEFGLHERSVARLTHRPFKNHRFLRIHGVRGAADDRAGETFIRSKAKGIAGTRHAFSGITTAQHPLTSLALEFHDIEDELTIRGPGRRE